MNPDSNTPEFLVEHSAATKRAFIEPDQKVIGGITLRRPQLGTFSILKDTKNEFLMPRGAIVDVPFKTPEGEETTVQMRDMENEFFAILSYIYIHAGPQEEVSRVSDNEAVFRQKALEFGQIVPLAQIGLFMVEIQRQLADIKILSVDVIPNPDDKSKSSGTIEPPKNSLSPAR